MASLGRFSQLGCTILAKQVRCAYRAGYEVSASRRDYSSVRQISENRKLFTPGPLTVSDRVKRAMLADVGTRNSEFTYLVQCMRNCLLNIAEVEEEVYTVIPLNGSGTFASESIIRSTLPPNKEKVIVLENGIYGKRLARLCKSSGIKVKSLPVDLRQLKETLAASNDVTGVIAVHCETSSGVVNPVAKIGEIVKSTLPESLYFVDAMASFGGIPVDMTNVDFIISNANKCLQGVPGISFVIANKSKLKQHLFKGNGLSLDIGAQYDELERTGQFRFTPPTHVVLAFKEALLEFLEEGGLDGRAARYKENALVLKKGMKEMGFVQLLSDEEHPLSYIVTSYHYPNNPLFVFHEFYNRLSDAGHVICTERTNTKKCFRIGSIGHLFPQDMRNLLISIRDVCTEMRIKLPLEDNNL